MDDQLPARKLSPREERYVLEYVKDLNGSAAAERAGYKQPRVASQKLQKRPEVKAAITAELAAAKKRLQLDADDVLIGLSRIAGADLAKLVDDMGRPLPMKDVPVELRMALAGVDIEAAFDTDPEAGRRYQSGDVVKVRLNDRVKALELLAKYHKLISDKVEHEHKVTLEVLVLEASKVPRGGG